MNFEHQTDLAKLPRYRTALWRTHRFRKGFLEIDLAAGARNTRNSFSGNSFLDSVPVPSFAQTLRPYVDIILVIGVPNIAGRPNRPQRRDSCESFAQECRVASPFFDHTWQFPQQHTPDCRLYFSEPPICAKRFMEKAVSRGMLTLIHRFVALAVVLEAPAHLP